MSRHFRKFMFLTAILFCALLLAIWLRSEFRADWVVFQRQASAGDVFVVESGWARGRWYLQQCTGVFGAMHTNSGSGELSAGNYWSIGEFKFDRDEIHFLGLEYWGGADSFLIYVPLWIPLALLATLLAWDYRRVRRARLSMGFAMLPSA